MLEGILVIPCQMPRLLAPCNACNKHDFQMVLVTPQDPFQGRDSHFTPQTRMFKV